jgi:hypothetical protein
MFRDNEMMFRKGYGNSGGSKTTAAELNAIFETMERNELLMPTRLLTGGKTLSMIFTACLTF